MANPPQPGAMTPAVYAARRGVSRTRVVQVIDGGKLPKSSTRDAKGHRWILDADLADREWEANTDYTRAPQRAPQRPAPDPWDDESAQTPDSDGDATEENATVASAAERQKHWQAKLARQKYEVAARKLIPAAEVEGEWTKILSAVRTKVLGLPSGAKQALPHLSVADVAKLEELVRECLTDLGNDRA